MNRGKVPDCSARIPILFRRTMDGMVRQERCSCLDRRSSWLRDFFMDSINKAPDQPLRSAGPPRHGLSIPDEKTGLRVIR